ncbi:DinB family protein [Sporichthya brevicatena]|uniref:DinB family protein n=1 Tax=Sporichthya brevicatena TaxID=171442 RepID=A0ABP3SE10_9ACTN
MDWNEQLCDQLERHWTGQLRPRLDGLTDDEYCWEPVPNCWNVRPRGTGTAIDFANPTPDPEPVTTIAWRLGHLIVGVFGMRVARHFGGPAMDYETFEYAGTAATALAQLDEAYAAWMAGVRTWTDEQLAAPCGEPGYEAFPRAALVLHISREAIHHGAEIALLRDLHIRLGFR